MSANMQEAETFYGELFGWQAHPQQTGGPPYTIFQIGDDQICGMGQLSDEMKSAGTPPVWNSYIHSADIEAASGKITALGGQVMMPPMQVTDAGSMLVFQDPTGAIASLWQPNAHFGADLTNVVNTWSWNDLATTNAEAARTFYGDLFGWTFEDAGDSPMPYASILNGDRKNGGLFPLPDGDQRPSCWNVYFSVDDADKAADKIKQLGGNIFMEPFDIPGTGRMGVAADAHGAAFCFMAMTVEPD